MGDQNPYIEEEQTSQCLEYIKGVIRIRKSKKNRQYNVLKIQMGDQNSYIEEERTIQWGIIMLIYIINNKNKLRRNKYKYYLFKSVKTVYKCTD